MRCSCLLQWNCSQLCKREQSLYLFYKEWRSSDCWKEKLTEAWHLPHVVQWQQGMSLKSKQERSVRKRTSLCPTDWSLWLWFSPTTGYQKQGVNACTDQGILGWVHNAFSTYTRLVGVAHPGLFLWISVSQQTTQSTITPCAVMLQKKRALLDQAKVTSSPPSCTSQWPTQGAAVPVQYPLNPTREFQPHETLQGQGTCLPLPQGKPQWA